MMKRFAAGVIFWLLFVSFGYGEIPIIADEQRAAMAPGDAQAYHQKAILKEEAESLAGGALKERNIDITKYDMLSIEEIQWSDTRVWFIVFQLKKAFRQDPKKSGGEIFVSIDQNTSGAEVTYAGCADSYQG